MKQNETKRGILKRSEMPDFERDSTICPSCAAILIGGRVLRCFTGIGDGCLANADRPDLSSANHSPESERPDERKNHRVESTGIEGADG